MEISPNVVQTFTWAELIRLLCSKVKGQDNHDLINIFKSDPQGFSSIHKLILATL